MRLLISLEILFRRGEICVACRWGWDEGKVSEGKVDEIVGEDKENLAYRVRRVQ